MELLMIGTVYPRCRKSTAARRKSTTAADDIFFISIVTSAPSSDAAARFIAAFNSRQLLLEMSLHAPLQAAAEGD
jgi:hypothetical protein